MKKKLFILGSFIAILALAISLNFKLNSNNVMASSLDLKTLEAKADFTVECNGQGTMVCYMGGYCCVTQCNGIVIECTGYHCY